VLHCTPHPSTVNDRSFVNRTVAPGIPRSEGWSGVERTVGQGGEQIPARVPAAPLRAPERPRKLPRRAQNVPGRAQGGAEWSAGRGGVERSVERSGALGGVKWSAGRSEVVERRAEITAGGGSMWSPKRSQAVIATLLSRRYQGGIAHNPFHDVLSERVVTTSQRSYPAWPTRASRHT
jgi:hypothetical protein